MRTRQSVAFCVLCLCRLRPLPKARMLLPNYCLLQILFRSNYVGGGGMVKLWRIVGHQSLMSQTLPSRASFSGNLCRHGPGFSGNLCRLHEPVFRNCRHVHFFFRKPLPSRVSFSGNICRRESVFFRKCLTS